MQNSEPIVKVSSDNGLSHQWARGLFYRKEGSKLRIKESSAKYTVIGVFTLALIFSTLFSSEDPVGNSSFNKPLSLSKNTSLELPVYNEEILKTQMRRISKKKRVSIPRLKLLKRKNALSIPLGTMASAVLITGGTNGPVKVKLTESLIMNGEEYLPEGAILLGQGASTDERLILKFTKTVFRDGTSKDISATAYDYKDQSLGLRGSRINRAAKKFAANAGLKFLAGVSQGLQDRDVQGGVSTPKPSVKNALLNGTGLAALEQSNEMMESMKDKQTIIEVPRGTKLLVSFGDY